MRPPVLLIPVILTLLSSDAGSALAPGGNPGVVFIGALAPQPADTGDSLLTRGRYQSLLPSAPGDSNGLPLSQCPMPVVRPDPDASVPMPTTGRHPGRDSVAFFRGPPPNVSRMPVVGSGCWNPLDRSQGGADSIGNGAAPGR